MPGALFVVQGDITEFQADAVACSTSTHLNSKGFTYSAFASRLPWFENAFAENRDRHPVRQREQRVSIGDCFWFANPDEADRLRGIVLVAATGGRETIAERAAMSVRNAIRLARERLRESVSSNTNRWLIALPTMGLGMGGYSRELKNAIDAMIAAAAEEAGRHEEVGGRAIDVDVVFVALTDLNYRLFLESRQTQGLEPACPLTGPECQHLLEAVRQRRCVLFVGAGLSRGAGLSDWGELLRNLAKDLHLELSTLPRDSGGSLAIDLCLDMAQWFEDQFGRERLNDRIYEIFAKDAGSQSRIRQTLAHYLLMSLPFRLCLTTNYDNLLERTLIALRNDPEVVTRPEQVGLTGQSERPCVVKLHGDAAERTKIILTRDDFDTFFRDHPVTTALLQGLLLNHTFLFVGYDMRDPNTRQIYSGVAHLLRGRPGKAADGAGSQRAYSIVVRDEDVTSQFYESQWNRQGLVTLRMPGPDRIHNSLRFFDWLGRQSCEVQSFLHPNLRREPAGEDLAYLARVREKLFELCEELESAIPLAKEGSPRSERIFFAVLELVVRLGWKFNDQELESLADATDDSRQRIRLLRRALAAAEQADERVRLRDRIATLGQSSADTES